MINKQFQPLYEYQTYILLNLERNLGDLLLVSDITLVVRNTPRLRVLHAIDIQHRHRRAAHTIHLSDEQAQSARTTRNDNNLFTEVHLTRDAVGDALVDHAGHPKERDDGGPSDGSHHRRGLPFYRLRAEAQRYNPTDKGVKKRGVENFEQEVDGERRKP